MGTEHNAEYYFDSALHKIADDDTKGGLADLNHAILLAPTSVEYYVERARLLYNVLDKLELDYQYYQSGIEDYNNLSQLQLSDLNTIIELGLDPDHLEFAHDQKSFLLGQLGRYQEQLAELNWLINYDHEYNVIPYYSNITSYCRQRASCEIRLGQFENAIRDYSDLLQLDADDTGALFERARVYYTIYRYQEAIDDMNKLLSFEKRYPGEAIAYKWRARCYYRLGKTVEAREDFIRSTVLDSGTPLDISAADYMRILFSED